MKKIIPIIFIGVVIILVGVYLVNDQIFEIPKTIQQGKMVEYSDSTYGFEFKFPERYGNVVLAGSNKLPVNSNPEGDGMMKTYANSASVVGQVMEYSNKIIFNNLERPEQYSSTTPVITEIYIVDLSDKSLGNVVFSPVNNKNVGLVEAGELLESVPDGYLTKLDSGYYLKKYTTKNGLIVLTNDGVGGLGTSFEKMYQVYSKNLVLEISVTYIPYAYTPEANEQEQYLKGRSGNDYWLAHREYLQTGETSQKLRDVFVEAEKIVDSLNISGMDNNSIVVNRTIVGNTFTDSDFGFSFRYSNQISITQSEDMISLKNTDTDTTDWITLKKVIGDSVTDSNGKFGKVTYAFVNREWTSSRSNERDGGMSTPIPVDMENGVTRTATNNPIFTGAIPTEGWGRFVYVVALSTNKFLIVEGPDNDVTYTLVRSIRSF